MSMCDMLHDLLRRKAVGWYRGFANTTSKFYVGFNIL